MAVKTTHLLGVDLGASQLRFILAERETGNTNVVAGRNSKISYNSPLSECGGVFADPFFSKIPDTEKVAAYVARKLQEYLEELDIGKETIAGIGVSVAGRIQSDGRFIGSNVPLEYAKKVGKSYGIDLLTSLRDVFSKHVNIVIENDGYCAGLVQSIYYEHMGVDPDTTFFITVGTGIGGGGPKRDLDEVGHIIVDASFPKLMLPCGCGAYGCIETYASGEGIKNQALNILNLFFEDQATFEKLDIFENIRTENRYSLQQIVDCSELKHLYEDKMDITTKEIFELANLDRKKDTTDKFAYYLIETAAERFAKALASLSNIHGIEHFGIGGSVVINNPRYLDIVRQKISLLHRCSNSIFKSNLKIEVSPLGEYITDYGALFLVVDPVHKKNWIDTIIRLQLNNSEERRI